MNADSGFSDVTKPIPPADELLKLQRENAALRSENKDLQSLIDIVTEHSTILENALETQNQEMAD